MEFVNKNKATIQITFKFSNLYIYFYKTSDARKLVITFLTIHFPFFFLIWKPFLFFSEVDLDKIDDYCK